MKQFEAFIRETFRMSVKISTKTLNRLGAAALGQPESTPVDDIQTSKISELIRNSDFGCQKENVRKLMELAIGKAIPSVDDIEYENERWYVITGVTNDPHNYISNRPFFMIHAHDQDCGPTEFKAIQRKEDKIKLGNKLPISPLVRLATQSEVKQEIEQWAGVEISYKAAKFFFQSPLLEGEL